MTLEKFNPNQIDRLKLYFGEPYSIETPTGNSIDIYQPTIGDIVERGEQKSYKTINILVSNPTMFRLQLWEQGIDWNDITEYELFLMLYKSLSIEDTDFLFGDLDFQEFDMYSVKAPDEEESHITLYNPTRDIEIDEFTYTNIVEYIRFLFNIYPKVELAKGKQTKKALIWEDKTKYEQSKNKPYSSVLLPMISACLNHPGFKYKKSELKEVGFVEFMDSVQRLQIYESTTALLKGMYSGFCDTSKIPKENFDFMREIKYGRKKLNPDFDKKNASIPELSGNDLRKK